MGATEGADDERFVAAGMTAEALIAAATETTGLDDFDGDEWREGLDRLVHALWREADLSALGVEVAKSQIADALVNRLRVIDWHRRHPEIGEAAVPSPVVVCGQPRTGTTILFDLLAQEPRFRVPLTWEVAAPHPPPETATYRTDPRIAEAEARAGLSEAIVPGMAAIHPTGAQRAQECVAITTGDFRSLLFSTVFRVPSYTRWLLWEADMTSAYRYHRQFLQLLQWRHPGERWLLKTPGHQWCFADLFAAYPDAVVVHTHRDPLKVLASVASLTSVLQRLGRDETSVPELAAEWADYLVEGNARSVSDRTSGVVPAGQAIDVAFADFMADPFAAIAGIYDRLGWDYSAESEAAMRAFLADNPSDKHGVHTYSWSATGLDESELRAANAAYVDHFSVPAERLG